MNLNRIMAESINQSRPTLLILLILQSVTSTGRSILLEGGVANGSARVRQSLIVNRDSFQFGVGIGY